MSLITIFNGRKRGLGQNKDDMYMQVSVHLREHLHLLKGAKLAVFLSIALRTDEHGWTSVQVSQISQDTGLKDKKTIEEALNELCNLVIDGHRVLLRERRLFLGNRYLIFPSIEEISMYESDDSSRGEKPPMTRGEKPPMTRGEKPPMTYKDNTKKDSEDTHTQETREETAPENSVCVSENSAENSARKSGPLRVTEHSQKAIDEYAESHNLGNGWKVEALKTGLYDEMIDAWLKSHNAIQSDKSAESAEAEKITQLTFREVAQKVSSLKTVLLPMQLSQFISEMDVTDEVREELRDKFLKVEVV